MERPDQEMLIHRWWLQADVITFLAGFGVLGYLASSMYADRPPVPERVLTQEGRILFTHGAYLGPDFTADYLHSAGQEMLAFHQRQGLSRAEAEARVRQELKQNRYDARSGELRFGRA